jgi:hypothetical protein
MTSSDEILTLVRTALDEFDDRPLEVSVRRAARIASLLGETQSAVRFGMELRPLGGSRTANGEDTRRLMADPSLWSDAEGPHNLAMREYFADRVASPDLGIGDNILVHSLAEIEFWKSEDQQSKPYELSTAQYAADLALRRRMHEIVAKTRHRTFTHLIMWEHQLSYAATNERVFVSYQNSVDRLLASGAPGLVEQFNAVYRRMREAAAADPLKPAEEELSQALTTCRRILKAVVDHVFPPEEPGDGDQPVLNDLKYRNRLSEFIKRSIESDSASEVVKAIITGLFERFRAVDAWTSKAVHASLAFEEAQLCAISTYILCGEILRVHVGMQGI